MDIPATLAKEMGGWENLARALHSVFLEQGEPKPKPPRTTRKKKYDAEWYYGLLLLFEGRVRKRGGRDSARFIIEKYINEVYLNGRIPPGPAARKRKVRLMQKRLSEARSRWGYADQGAVRGAINHALQVEHGIDHLDWEKLHHDKT